MCTCLLMIRPSLKSFLMFFPVSSIRSIVTLTRVGEGNFVGLVGVDPNSLFTALEHGGCEPLL